MVKLRALFNSIDALRNLSEKELPAFLSFKIKKNLDLIQKELDTMEMVRQGLIKKYGKKQDNGNILITQEDSESMNLFLTEFNELLSQDSEINLSLISLSKLENSEIKISAKDLALLDFLIDEES